MESNLQSLKRNKEEQFKPVTNVVGKNNFKAILKEDVSSVTNALTNSRNALFQSKISDFLNENNQYGLDYLKEVHVDNLDALHNIGNEDIQRQILEIKDSVDQFFAQDNKLSSTTIDKFKNAKVRKRSIWSMLFGR